MRGYFNYLTDFTRQALHSITATQAPDFPPLFTYADDAGYRAYTKMQWRNDWKPLLFSQGVDSIEAFHKELIYYLIAYSSRSITADMVTTLLSSYKSHVSEVLFQKIEKTFTDIFPEGWDRASDAKDLNFSKEVRLTQLVRILNDRFRDAQRLLVEEQKTEQAIVPRVSSKNSTSLFGKEFFSIFTQGVRQVIEHPKQALLWGLAMQASAAAALQSTRSVSERALGDEFRINEFVDNSPSWNSVAAFPSGGAVVMYMHYDSMGLNGGVYARQFDNTGMALGSEFQVNVYDTYNVADQLRPNVATFSDNGFIGIWQARNQITMMEGAVYARRYNNNSVPLGPEFLIDNSSPPGIVHWHPKVATFSDRGFVTVWDQFDVGGGGVYSRYFDSNNLPLGPEIVLSSFLTYNERFPKMAILPSSNKVVVVWRDTVQTEVNYTGSTNIGDMGYLEIAFDGVTGNMMNPQSTEKNGDTAFVGKDWGVGNEKILTGVETWGRDNDGYTNGNPFITIQVYGSNSAPTSATDGTALRTIYDQLDTSTTNPLSVLTGFPSVSYQYHWIGMNRSNSDWWWVTEVKFHENLYAIDARRYDQSGVPLTPEFQISNASPSVVTWPTIAAFPDTEEFVAAWVKQVQGNNNIYFQRYGNSSNPLGPMALVTQSGIYPEIVTFPGGGSFVVWGKNDDIFGRFINPLGIKTGPEFPINLYTNGTQTFPHIARLSNNNLFVTWSGEGVDDPDGVYGRILDTQLVTTGLNQTRSYTLNTLTNLATITITPPAFINDINVRMILSDLTAGTLSTATEGNVTSTFNPVTGMWEAAGYFGNINTLLSSPLSFQPSFNYQGNFTIGVNIDDGINKINDTIFSVNYFPTTTASTTTSIPASSVPTTMSSSSSSTPSFFSTAPTEPTMTMSDSVVDPSSRFSTSETGLMALWIALAAIGGGLLLCGSLVAAGIVFLRKKRAPEERLELGNMPKQPDVRLTSSGSTLAQANTPTTTRAAVTASPNGTPTSSRVAALSPHTTPAVPSRTTNGEDNFVMTGGVRKMVGKYELRKDITRDEAIAIRAQSGLVIPFAPTQESVSFILGKGNYGSIFIAFDTEKNRYVACKEIKGESNIEASKKEAALHNKVDTMKLPHIMPIYNTLSAPKALYHFMPLAGYGNGKYVQKRLGHCSNGETKQKIFNTIAHDLLAAVKKLHERHVYHLDLALQNIVFKNDGGLLVTDFGCAVEDTTKQGMLQGSKGNRCYLPPERLAHYRGDQRVSRYPAGASDAWAVGIMLLELLTGSNPFTAMPPSNLRSLAEINSYYQGQLDRVEALLNPEPDSIEAVICGLLAIDPKARLTPAKALEFFAFDRRSMQVVSAASTRRSLRICSKQERKEMFASLLPSDVSEEKTTTAAEIMHDYNHAQQEQFYLYDDGKQDHFTTVSLKEEKGEEEEFLYSNETEEKGDGGTTTQSGYSQYSAAFFSPGVSPAPQQNPRRDTSSEEQKDLYQNEEGEDYLYQTP